MVLTEQTLTAEVVFHNKKKYKRVVLKNSVEWRRFKTNHQVTKEQHEALEAEYKIAFPKEYLVTFRKDGFDLKDDSQRVFLENNLVASSDNGKSLLAGVKRVKEITDWGLKDSRDYVVAFFERRDKYNKATKRGL